MHHAVPRLEKQWLISPPPSPPVGWKPILEDPPVVNVELVEALMGLDPRKPRELHAANEVTFKSGRRASAPAINVVLADSDSSDDEEANAPANGKKLNFISMPPAWGKQPGTTHGAPWQKGEKSLVTKMPPRRRRSSEPVLPLGGSSSGSAVGSGSGSGGAGASVPPNAAAVPEEEMDVGTENEYESARTTLTLSGDVLEAGTAKGNERGGARAASVAVPPHDAEATSRSRPTAEDDDDDDDDEPTATVVDAAPTPTLPTVDVPPTLTSLNVTEECNEEDVRMEQTEDDTQSVGGGGGISCCTGGFTVRNAGWSLPHPVSKNTSNADPSVSSAETTDSCLNDDCPNRQPLHLRVAEGLRREQQDAVEPEHSPEDIRNTDLQLEQDSAASAAAANGTETYLGEQTMSSAGAGRFYM